VCELNFSSEATVFGSSVGEIILRGCLKFKGEFRIDGSLVIKKRNENNAKEVK
jgi:hypothetical protein